MSDTTAPLPPQDDVAQSFLLPDAAKLEALAEFAAGAGHEINNPLATIIGRAQLLLKDEHDPQRRQMLLSIGAQAYRIRDMIGDTMLFGRPPSPEFTTVNLAELVNHVIAKLADEFASNHCLVRSEIEKELFIRADFTQIAIVLNELLQNSRHALIPDGGEIQISAMIQTNKAIIDVIDRGRGFTELERQHAFDPFFSGRQAGRGLGFGLSKCWRIIDQHSGEMQIQSAPNGPTIVRVSLPLASAKQS